MNITATCLLILVLGTCVCAQNGASWDLMSAVGDDRARIPSLGDLFLDVSALLQRADPLQAETLRARLEWNGRQSAAFRRLREQVRSGLSVEIPEDLLSPVVPGASPEMLERVRREVAGLRARHALATTGSERERKSRGAATGDTNLSTFGMAVLYIEQDLPMPPDSVAGSVESVRVTANREELGKSLQRLGDFQGALNAFSAIDEGKRSPAVWYRIGQCNERLERWGGAERSYKKLIEIAPDRVWGRMATQRLEFGRKKNAIGSDGKEGR